MDENNPDSASRAVPEVKGHQMVVFEYRMPGLRQRRTASNNNEHT
jgi:hypothetical protein